MGKGGIIGRPNEPTAEVASGMWSLREHYNAVKNNIWPITATDPYFNYVTMLLQGNGTNGAQNNTFLDGSPNNFTITRNGNTTQGSLNPFGDRWSNYFDGNGDYLSAADNTSLNLTSGNFTIEAWVYWNGANAYGTVVCKDGQFGSTYTQYEISLDNNGYMRFVVGSGTTTASFQTVTSSVLLPKNSWVHIAGVKNGTTLTLYQNGVSVASATQTVTMGTSNKALFIGYHNGQPSSFYWDGYISNLRIVKGTAVYTAAFTPPAAPLTAITNTSLLTCQSNRFIDNSSNNFTITRNGDVSVRPFSPFAPSAEYSASVNGGSGYFDGNGDFVQTPTDSILAFNSTNYTVEAWVYVDMSTYSAFDTGGRGILSDYLTGSQGRWFVNIDVNGKLAFVEQDSSGTNTVSVIDSASFPLRQWVHVLAVKSGTTMYLFKNGISVGTATSASRTQFGGRINVGQLTPDTNYRAYFLGYISNARLLKGTALYTANFTPPTAPLTAITNTSLLLNFTNAGIIDSTADNVLETVGNAQISTGVKKYGTGALAFDGSGDYLTYPAGLNAAFGTGDFTVELWANFTNASGTAFYYIDNRNASQTATWALYRSSANYLEWYTGSANIIGTGATLVAGQWYHVAYTRSGTTGRLFLNGTQIGTGTDSTNYSVVSSVAYIGSRYSANEQINGYIDDLRITKGVARYTSNFTPPTAGLPRQ